MGLICLCLTGKEAHRRRYDFNWLTPLIDYWCPLVCYLNHLNSRCWDWSKSHRDYLLLRPHQCFSIFISSLFDSLYEARRPLFLLVFYFLICLSHVLSWWKRKLCLSQHVIPLWCLRLNFDRFTCILTTQSYYCEDWQALICHFRNCGKVKISS